MKRLLKRALAGGLSRTMLAAVAGAGLAAASLPAQAVEYPVNFGEPVVLSERGQPLKVLLPFEGTPNDRASAVAFLVENAEVPDGFRAPVARNFVIMRPDASPYVIFHSEEDVTAPQILLTVNVMGDPNSPYQMRLSIPENGGDRTMMAMAATTDARAPAGAAVEPTRSARCPLRWRAPICRRSDQPSRAAGRSGLKILSSA